MEGCPQGDFKPLLPWKGKPLARALIDTCLDAGLKAIVVTGWRGGELARALGTAPGLSYAANPEWQEGLAGSLLAGARAASEPSAGARGFFVAHADMPLIPRRAFELIIEQEGRRKENGAEPITLFPASEGRTGHPVWIPFSALPGLKALGRGAKVRDFLLQGPWAPVELGPGQDGIFFDIDSAEEYERACRPI